MRARRPQKKGFYILLGILQVQLKDAVADSRQPITPDFVSVILCSLS